MRTVRSGSLRVLYLAAGKIPFMLNEWVLQRTALSHPLKTLLFAALGAAVDPIMEKCNTELPSAQ
jgi:hypothetical protein